MEYLASLRTVVWINNCSNFRMVHMFTRILTFFFNETITIGTIINDAVTIKGILKEKITMIEKWKNCYRGIQCSVRTMKHKYKLHLVNQWSSNFVCNLLSSKCSFVSQKCTETQSNHVQCKNLDIFRHPLLLTTDQSIRLECHIFPE